MALLQVGLVIIGLLAWFITKNPRWVILTILGVAWFVIDIIVIVVRLAQIGG